MKILFSIVVVLLSSTVAFAAMTKEEAITSAEQQAERSSPPMNQSQAQNAQAVYMPHENAWIVDFADVSAGSDYMLRVEASSGRSPELLQGSQKSRYQSEFTTETNRN